MEDKKASARIAELEEENELLKSDMDDKDYSIDEWRTKSGHQDKQINRLIRIMAKNKADIGLLTQLEQALSEIDGLRKGLSSIRDNIQESSLCWRVWDQATKALNRPTSRTHILS